MDTKYILDMNMLQKGDIILSTQKHPISKSIKLATKSSISHAIIYVGNGSYIHADGDGVHANNIQRLLFNKKSYVKVLRVKNIDKKIIEEACIFSRNEIGKQYSIKDAINTINPLSKNSYTNRQFCSRLVAQAYSYADIALVKNSDYCSPQELEDSDLTELIPNCLREALESEIEFASTESPLEKQTKITNEIFKKSRKIIGKDLQTYEQLTQCIIDNPKYDAEITKIIENSGYLFLWQIETQDNPWRYNIDEFIKLPLSKDKLLNFARKELESAEDLKHNYLLMYNLFLEIFQNTQLQFSVIHIILYKKLLELTNLRIMICKDILDNF